MDIQCLLNDFSFFFVIVKFILIGIGGIENVRESRLDDSIKQIAEGLPLAVEGDLVLLHNAIRRKRGKEIFRDQAIQS